MAKNKKLRRKVLNTKKKSADKQAKLAKFFGILLFAAAVVSGGYLTYSAGYLRFSDDISEAVRSKIAINNCNIKGDEGLNREEIENCITLGDTATFFNISTKEIEDNIAKIASIEKVKVSKKPLSQILDVKITKRIAKYRVNIENVPYWADKDGYLWKGIKNSEVNTPLVFGLRAVSENGINKRVEKSDFERLVNTIEKISGTGKNSDNIKEVHFKKNGVVEFTASNISVFVRINGTLKYNSDDFEYFESVLRKNNRTPTKYLDAYENCIYSM